MFNRSLFDRAVFDRSSGFLSMEPDLFGEGGLDCKFLWITQTADFSLSGEGNMKPLTNMIVTTPFNQDEFGMPGEGDLKGNKLDLPIWLQQILDGEGDLLAESVQGQTMPVKMEGEGDLSGSDMDLSMEIDDFDILENVGNVKIDNFQLEMDYDPFELTGNEGNITVDKIDLPLNLSPVLDGDGNITVVIDTIRFIMGLVLPGEGNVNIKDLYFPLYLQNDNAVTLYGEGDLSVPGYRNATDIKPKLTGEGALSSAFALEVKLKFRDDMVPGEGNLVTMAEFAIPIAKTTVPGEGNLSVDKNMLIVQTMTVNDNAIAGVGDLNVKPIFQFNMSVKVGGEGGITANYRNGVYPKLKESLNGEGGLITNAVFKTPISKNKTTVSGEGTITKTEILKIQTMTGKRIDGVGDLITKNLRFVQDLSLKEGKFTGEGSLQGVVLNRISYKGVIDGEGSLIVNVMSMDRDELVLNGINLAPGNQLVIDTDTYDVYKNGATDVSSVTSDSVFFQLLPGENDILFDYDTTSGKLQVEAIFSNRWL